MHVDPLDVLLGSGLDLSRPFSSKQAIQAGVRRAHLTALVADDLLRRPIEGVLHASHLPDGVELRLECLRLVVPTGAVVTDRTAGWLHGASMILAPGDHLVAPKVSMFQPPGLRLRNKIAASGERRLSPGDVMELQGLRVTSPLRTACDLGRLLQRGSALAALDAMLRTGTFELDQLLRETPRFRGFRGIRQLRTLAPLTDAGSESYGESVLRLRWYEAGIPYRPETQIEVHSGEDGRWARIDLGCQEILYGAEYDGEEFHGDDRRQHDRSRREWLAARGWTIDVFRRANVFGQKQDAHDRLSIGYRRAELSRATR